MKSLFLVISLLFSLSVVAGNDGDYLSCSNGTIHDVGDGLMNVEVRGDYINFYIYESSFSLKVSELQSEPTIDEMKATGMYYRFVKKVIKLTSEGEEYDSNVSGLVVVSRDGKKMTTDLSFEGRDTRTERHTCVIKTEKN